LLVSASGKTLDQSGYEYLHHTASTQKGFSGSTLLCGSSVVGMHISAAGEHNVAVRTELIQYLIDVGTGNEAKTKNRKKYTYADASMKEHYRQNKWRGAVAKIKTMRDGKFAVELENGEATYGWSLNDLVECFGATGDRERDFDILEDQIMDSRRKYRSDYVDFDDDRYHRGHFENASISSVTRPKRAKRKPVRRALLSEEADAYKVVGKEKPIHGPTAPKMQSEACLAIERRYDEIVALGYEEGAFTYPTLTPQEEKTSLVKHLELFAQRVRNVVKPPTLAEMKRCVTILATMLKPATFMPDPDYDEPSGILNIIHSSIISPCKASGFPYCAEGHPTNGQVLEAYGEKGFAQRVIQEWLKPIVFKWFGKGEPTKKKKIDAGMPRGITNFPLHATICHASILKNFAFAVVKNLKQLPIKYAWSPANPGHLEHLKETLPGKIWESDKEVWDFSWLSWHSFVCREVTKLLAVKPPSWNEARYLKYMADVDGMFEQVFVKSRYRVSDGTVFEVKEEGIMKSGWFGTILYNSIAQLACHIMTCIRLGLSDDDILAIAIVAGGDDVNQDPAGLDVDAYTEASRQLGVKMVIHEREDLEHSEYFSNDIRKGPEGLAYFPKRWTKHIEHLKTVKLEHLGNALVSHMENYRHDADKFALLEKLYHDLRESHPEHFPVSELNSRQYLLAKQYGYESAWC